MTYLALYRKYRPNSFDDLVGQSSVSSIIKNEILSNKLSHAYLFSGPRGTGKTSTAKIIAKMINCKNLGVDGSPCGECDCCLNYLNSNDIVEIDAASNNGVDEIRELRDKVNLVPTSGKYKVYIIDEVHMLTTQAFNALLKTLEEPPSHIIFILATTEFYKIPATIVSRCQKFQFFKFTNDEIVNRLSEIAKLESIVVDNSILYEIARLSDGGLRDAINMLDQLSSFSNDIAIDDLYKLNGVVSYTDLILLLKYIYDRDIVNIVKFVDSLYYEGKSIDKFMNDLLFLLKDYLLLKNNFDDNLNILVDKKEKLMEIIDLYSTNDLYNFIFSLNDLNNKIKTSSFSSILLITYFVRFSKGLKNNDSVESVVVEKDSLNSDKNIDSNVVISNESDSFKVLEKKDEKKVFFDFNLRKIRINNSFATASKKYKDEFNKVWVNIKNNVDVGKYNSIIGFVDDLDVMVVGDKNVIFVAKYDSLLDIIYNYIDEFESFLKDVYNKIYKIIIISKDDWSYEKDNYVNNIKSGYKYNYLGENNNSLLNNESVSSKNDDLGKIKELLGDDIILYK